MVPITLLDSSYFTAAVYDYCRRFIMVSPCKGSSTSNFDKTYRTSGFEQTDNARKLELQRRLGGLTLFIVNTEQTQQWIEGVIRGRTKPTDPYGVSLPEAVGAAGEAACS